MATSSVTAAAHTPPSAPAAARGAASRAQASPCSIRPRRYPSSSDSRHRSCTSLRSQPAGAAGTLQPSHLQHASSYLLLLSAACHVHRRA